MKFRGFRGLCARLRKPFRTPCYFAGFSYSPARRCDVLLAPRAGHRDTCKNIPAVSSVGAKRNGDGPAMVGRSQPGGKAGISK